jgi:hypothetical protein
LQGLTQSRIVLTARMYSRTEMETGVSITFQKTTSGTRRSGQEIPLVGVHGGSSRDQIVRIETTSKLATVLVGFSGLAAASSCRRCSIVFTNCCGIGIVGGVTGSASIIGCCRIFPLRKSVANLRHNSSQHRVAAARKSLGQSQDSPPTFLVNQVKICSKITSINGMIRSRVNMELKCVVWNSLSWDSHARWSAATSFDVVCCYDDMIVDGEIDIIEGA